MQGRGRDLPGTKQGCTGRVQTSVCCRGPAPGASTLPRASQGCRAAPDPWRAQPPEGHLVHKAPLGPCRDSTRPRSRSMGCVDSSTVPGVAGSVMVSEHPSEEAQLRVCMSGLGQSLWVRALLCPAGGGGCPVQSPSRGSEGRGGTGQREIGKKAAGQEAPVGTCVHAPSLGPSSPAVRDASTEPGAGPE